MDPANAGDIPHPGRSFLQAEAQLLRSGYADPSHHHKCGKLSCMFCEPGWRSCSSLVLIFF